MSAAGLVSQRGEARSAVLSPSAVPLRILLRVLFPSVFFLRVLWQRRRADITRICVRVGSPLLAMVSGYVAFPGTGANVI